MPVEVEVPAWLFSCSFADGKMQVDVVKYAYQVTPMANVTVTKTNYVN